MKFFVDTADIAEIRELATAGVVDGVTTNPSLIAKTGRPIREVVKEICEAIEGPVSAEVTATEFDGMIAEGEQLASIAANVAVKVPSTWDGFRACRALSERGLEVNVTLCFSANQALFAAKAGAAYISPFVGRLDDIGLDGMEVVREIRAIYDNDKSFNTQILASSIRTPRAVTKAAMAGADIATVPPAVLRNLAKHPLTEKGLVSFLADWGRTGQAIL
ncbi:transaldolase 2 (plasmid) [Rhizobium etli 8C-3]|uniref:Probable transaldolase n=2 Tax=Rhizobium TaxID=379 RepID=A0A1L5PIB1_RHIET|nr:MULTISPECIES: fructose-6-phosphate aldolase [Rhizobium]APO79805.1 transaldolase 2 [Rhizobium etli 8C-3]TCU30599.1 transaldolase [Rhizobium azibense]